MPNPLTATPFEQAVDPRDELDFYIYVSQGEPDANPATILLTGEGIASYELALLPEAIAAGLQIMTGAYANALTDNELKVWLTVDPIMRGSSIFDGTGVVVGIELTIVTTSTPPRVKQRTFLVRIANQ